MRPEFFLRFRPDRSRWCAALFLCLLTLPAQANLGESVAQCVARYGRPIHFSEATATTPFGTLTFTAGGYALIVFISNDKEVGARVSKIDKSAFTAAELQNIMGADAGDSKWTSTAIDDPTCLAWTRGDQAKVLYDKDKHMVIFTSPEMAKAMQSAQPAPTAPVPALPTPPAAPAKAPAAN
jgi:hypothetical protein